MALSISPKDIVDKDEHPLLRIGTGWKRVPLKDIADVQNGFPFKSGLFNVNDGFPLIRIRDVGRDEGTKYFYSGDYDDDFVVKRGDILIGMDGDFRAARWHGPYALLNQRVCRIILKSEAFDERFLFVCLQPYLDAIHSETSSVTVKHLSSRTIQDIPLPLPPLNEQRRIVDKIEAMFERIDKGVENLRDARRTLGLYRQSLLKSAFEGRLTAAWRAANPDKLEDPKTLLARIQSERDTRYKSALEDWQTALTDWRDGGEEGKKPAKPRRYDDVARPSANELEEFPSLPSTWQWVKFGEIFGVFVGSTPSRKVSNYWGGEVGWVSSGEVQFGTITETAQTLSEAGFENMSGEIHPVGTVLLGMIGEGKTRGQAAILACEATHNQNCAAIRVSETEIPSRLVFEFLRYRYEITRGLGSGNNQKALNKSRVQEMIFPICSPAEQNEITRILDARLDAADKMESEIDAALARADALRQSILKQAFAGDLVPQDPTDEPAPTLLARIKAERAAALKNKTAKAKAAKPAKRKTAHGR